jgi:hypothetical protein
LRLAALVAVDNLVWVLSAKGEDKTWAPNILAGVLQNAVTRSAALVDCQLHKAIGRQRFIKQNMNETRQKQMKRDKNNVTNLDMNFF